MGYVTRIEDLPKRLQEQARKKLGEEEPKKSKYHNVKTSADGIIFDSTHEATRYKELCLLCKAKEICALSTQVKFVLPGGIVYIADFMYYDLRSLSFVVEDAKGFRTKEYRIKKKLMHEIGIEIEEV